MGEIKKSKFLKTDMHDMHMCLNLGETLLDEREKLRRGYENLGINISYNGYEWLMRATLGFKGFKQRGVIPVKFCPFCGKKLEVKPS